MQVQQTHENVYRLRPSRERDDEIVMTDIYHVCRFVQREIRESGWKFSALAREAGVCPNTVSRLAYGDTRAPRFLTVMAILNTLGFELIARR